MSGVQSPTLLSLAFLTAGVLGQEPPKPDTKPVATFGGHATGVTAVAFSPDGRRVTSACSNDLRTWDPATGQEAGAVKGVGGRVVALSPDGKRVAVAGRERVTVYDAATGKEVLSIDPHGDYDRKFPFRPAVAAVAFSPDGRRLATAGSVAKVGGRHGLPGGGVAVWDAQSGRAVHRFDQLSTGASAVAFSSDGKSIAAGTNGAGGELPEPGEVWVWDAEKGQVLHTLKARNEARPGEFISVADVAVSPDGKRVAAAVGAGSRGRPAGLLIDDKPASVRVWELATGRELLDLKGHTTWVGRVLFSPDGKRLASAGGDRVVRVWAADTGKEVHAFPLAVARIDALAFSPDGARLAAGGGDDRKPGEVKVWGLAKD